MASALDSELLTRREAAALANLPLRSVDRAIEDKVVRARRRSKPRRMVLLTIGDVVLISLLRRADLPLPAKTKKQIRKWIYEEEPHFSDKEEELTLSDVLIVRVDRGVSAMTRKADNYLRARERYIEQDPEIRRGEPVIKGTRLPVRAIAERITHGDTIDDVREDYPDVPRRAIETALTYAATHPRRGRPARPWRGNE